MHHEAADTLQCVDCGKSASRASVHLHLGAVSAPSDEGHVRHTRVPLCDRCAERRLAVQEPNFV
jgi:hypothetical protein